jgi:hypothetical protein
MPEIFRQLLTTTRFPFFTHLWEELIHLLGSLLLNGW